MIKVHPFRSRLSVVARCAALVSLVLLIFGGPAAAAQDNRNEVDPGVVIHNDNTDARRCYQAARAGKGDSASLESCNKAVKNGAAGKRSTGINHVNRGVIRYNGSDFLGATKDFLIALNKYDLRSPQAYVNLGLTYEMLASTNRRYDLKAKEAYQNALDINPRNPIAKRRIEQLNKPFIERDPIGRVMRV